ncbi:MAG: S8 family peptidase [Caldimonas sp.]
MRRILIGAAALAATLLAPLALRTPLAQSSLAATTAQAGNARVIVKYRANSSLLRKQALSEVGQRVMQAEALGQRIGVKLTAGRSLTDRSHVVIASGMTSAQLAARIGAQSDIEYAVADERKHIVAAPNDSFYASRLPVGVASGGPAVGQWYLKPPGPDSTAANTAPAAINAEQAWDITTGNAGVVVAVLDTGLRFDHPDLQGGNVLPGYDMVSPDGATGTLFVTANDGDGRDASAADPGDWVTTAESTDTTSPLSGCTVENSSWHGTQTLGLIGAMTNNGAGIASVGRNVTVMPVRVLGKCGGFDSDILAGMRWASGIHVPGVPDNANKARVINMSLGGSSGCSQAYVDAMTEISAVVPSVTVVASAGNSAGHLVGTPAACPNVIAVAGLRHVGDKVGFSDIGPEVAISAPGGNCVNSNGACLYPIMTTANSGTTTPVLGAAGAIYTDSFNASLGTSFSSPLVAGAVALMLSTQPALSTAEVRAKLQSSARPFPTTGGTAGIPQCVAPTSVSMDQNECYCVTGVCGAGMLDVHAAVVAAASAQARITVTTAVPTALQAISLTGANSIIAPGRAVVGYQWAIVSNGGIVTGFVNNITTGATVSIVPSAAGSFTVSLTTTDDLGTMSTTTSNIGVAAAVVVTPPPPPPTDSGGGALGAGWLALLLCAVLGLDATARRERAREARLSAAARPSRRG